MPATGAAKAAVEKKAVGAESKSAGLRLLFEAGYTVAEARQVIGVPYGFAYGVARRGGFAETAAARRAPKAKAAKAAKAAPAKAKTPVKGSKVAAVAAKAAPASKTKRTAKS